MPDGYAKPMKMLIKPVLHACLGALRLAGGASAQPPDHGRQDGNGRSAKRQGGGADSLPVREIERRVIPRMPGAQYLGFDYDPGTKVYTLKFLRNGSVIWVDVDGRSGRILRRTGN